MEPAPGNFQILTRNLEASHFHDRSRAIRAAVWSDAGPLEMSKPDSAGHVNQYRVKLPAAGGQGSGSITGMTICQILENSGFSMIDLLKVDIEGAEVKLFEGNVDWLTRVRWMALEFHNDSRRESDFDAKMTRYGFKILDESSHTVVVGRDERF